jgi:isocitrate dehydrogenase (NAD+)
LKYAFSLDPIANSIASATFNVINEGKVRTADMGGELHDFSRHLSCYKQHFEGSATTSDFTAAIIQKL